jgi:hypothetical protein
MKALWFVELFVSESKSPARRLFSDSRFDGENPVEDEEELCWLEAPSILNLHVFLEVDMLTEELLSSKVAFSSTAVQMYVVANRRSRGLAGRDITRKVTAKYSLKNATTAKKKPPRRTAEFSIGVRRYASRN